MNNGPKIYIVDSPCGKGKSTKMRDMMNKLKDTHKFIYVSPRVDDVNVLYRDCAELNFKTPTEIKQKNKDGIEKIVKAKLQDFKDLVKKRFNIAITHELFRRFDDEVCKILNNQKYILIQDETVSMIDVIDINDRDLLMLLYAKVLRVNEDTLEVTWDETYKGRFNEYKKYFKTGRVFLQDKTSLVWVYPIEVLKCFDEIFICTFEFEKQDQSYYFKLYDIKYRKFSVENNNLISYIRQPLNFENLYIIDDPKVNSIGDAKYKNGMWYENAFSKNFCKDPKHSKAIKALAKSIRYTERNYFDRRATEYVWVVNKDIEEDIASQMERGHKNNHIPCNSRGYEIPAKNIIYAVNLYMNPTLVNFYKQHNIEIDEENFSLFNTLQTIWRTNIRKGEDITVAIPIFRTRRILGQYIREIMGDEFFATFLAKNVVNRRKN